MIRLLELVPQSRTLSWKPLSTCLAAVIIVIFVLPSLALGYYWPPTNAPVGSPPNYPEVDTTYFIGAPVLPLPPPDDNGGFYVHFDQVNRRWTIANHIYSKGGSLEQFHGSVLAVFDTPPQLGVNILMDNFELWEDTTSKKCLDQNDRWGWSEWDAAAGLYEIWWDVTTKEWKEGAGDVNDFMTICISGCAVEFNLWSSGHGVPFDASQVYLGQSKTPLSSVSGYTDPFSLDVLDQYQSTDPKGDPNTSAFTPHIGAGESYNALGLISSTDSYVCDASYGAHYSGARVYEGDGIQFSAQCQQCNLGIVCPSDIAAGTDPGGCDATVFFEPTITGDCPGVTVVSTPPSGSAFPVGVTTITCTATDLEGNTAVCSFTVTVNDAEAPVVSCPANVVVGNDPGQCDAVVDYPAATANDNCPGVTVACVPGSGSTFPLGVTTVTCTATDAAGNTETCSFTVTVNDAEAPVVGCPVDVVVGNDPGQCDAVVDYAAATATDNCPGVTVACVPGSGSMFPLGVTTVICTATDAAGNTDVCTFTVTVNDVEAPFCSVPDNPTILQDCGPLEVCLPVSAADNCDADVSCSVIGGPGLIVDGDWCYTPAGGEVVNVSVRCTDLSGNSCDASFTVTFVAGEILEIACPGDESLVCVEPGPYCDPSEATVTGGVTPISVECDCTDNGGSGCSDDPLIVTCTYTATDACGNTAQCQRTITFSDDTPPAIVSCPQDITVQRFLDLPPCDPGDVTVSDNCTVIVTCQRSNPAGVGCTDTPVDVVYFWTATDACGNSTQCQRTVTVVRPDCPLPVTEEVASSTCTCICHGDPSCDGETSVLDVVKSVNVAFRSGLSVLGQGCPNVQTDVNCDGVTSVIDVVRFVNVAFRNFDPASQFCDACAQ